MSNIFQRGNTWYLRRGVPRRYAEIEPRKIVWESLHTDSRMVALRKAHEIWALRIEAWEGALRGDGSDAKARHAAAVEIAAKRGFSYMTSDQLARAPLPELLDRIDRLQSISNETRFRREGLALLGSVPEPAPGSAPENDFTLSKALEEFWTISVDQIRGKSADQIRRWKNPRIKAFENLKRVIGDKKISALTRADMKSFKDWWNARIDAEGLSANSANKDITHISHTLRVINDEYDLKLELPVGNLKIKETEKAQRIPFSDNWIRNVLLKPKALEALNAEARCIFLVCINTGARPSEISGLMKHHIHLDRDVPYIDILPEGRKLKNGPSKRKIPLVGCSFAAIKDYLSCPFDGTLAFPRYFGKDSLTVTVNKFLRENKLLEKDGQTFYGLRHAFEDRMTAAEPAWPERMKCDVFGHALGRQRYGDGATLEHTYRRMLEIAL